MAYCRRSRSPPRPSKAPRFACSGASDHALKEEDEDDDGEEQEPSLANDAPRFAYCGATEHTAEEEDENDAQIHEDDAAEDEQELPPRPSKAPRFACSGASEHALKEEDEDDDGEKQEPSMADHSGASEHTVEEEHENDAQDHEENAAEDEQEEPSMADHTHPAARILEQTMQRVSASASNNARLRRDWFIDLKRDVIATTHLPLTHADLARGSARGPGKKPPTGGLWPTTMEAISRSVAAYNRAASATEHDACDGIVASIVAYAHTLRLRTYRPDEFINLLHQWIENRSVNVALKRILDGVFTKGGRWQRFSPDEQATALEVLELSFETVRASGDMLRSSMDRLRKQIH